MIIQNANDSSNDIRATELLYNLVKNKGIAYISFINSKFHVLDEISINYNNEFNIINIYNNQLDLVIDLNNQEYKIHDHELVIYSLGITISFGN